MMEYLDYFIGAALAAVVCCWLQYRQAKREQYWKEQEQIADEQQHEANQWLASQKYIQIGNVIYRRADQDESCDQIINGIRWRACDIAK